MGPIRIARRSPVRIVQPDARVPGGAGSAGTCPAQEEFLIMAMQTTPSALRAEQLCERLFESLIVGDRPRARALVQQALSDGCSPRELLTDIFWPTYQTIDRLNRADQISTLSHHMATRLLRVIVDQTAARLPLAPRNGRSILCFCGPSQTDELGAQIAVDLLEAGGFEVCFGGARVANDEILASVNERCPSTLLLFASAPSDLPHIRELIDRIREINAHPQLQIAVGAGVFNRAEGLAEEIGADLWAATPQEIVERLIREPDRRSDRAQRAASRSRRATRTRAA
jgi:methanogenic corrinoid protein MtbC1